LVRSIMMYSPDSAIDGAVLDVILRKAEEIRKATGVTVPLPEERGPVTDALLSAMMLHRKNTSQMAFDFGLDESSKEMEIRWRDASENEKKSRARFAQNAMKPQEVAPEWEKVRSLLGSPDDAHQFIEKAMARFGVPLEARKNTILAHVHALDAGLRERLAQRELSGTLRLATSEPAPAKTTLLTRAHPLTMTLADALVEASLDAESMVSLGIGRVGAWPTAAVTKMTRLALLRIRFKLTVHARRERLLLAEETALVAIEGNSIVARGEAARKLLNTPAAADLASPAQERFINKAKEELPALLDGALAEFVTSRADELAQDHARLRSATGFSPRITVEAITPPDVIGLFVLLPSEV
jgi:hypothetical protein